MKLLIDKAECDKQGVSMALAMYLAALYHKELITDDTFHEACNQGLIEYDGFDSRRHPINPKLTVQGVELAETLFLNSEFKEEGKKKDRFDVLAPKLRELFPEGRKEGTSLMWRDSDQVIAKRLKALVKKFDAEFTDEQAIAATKRYVESFNGSYQFMQVLKYFIIKKNTVTGDENSQLLSYIQNEGSEDLNTNWMDSVR